MTSKTALTTVAFFTSFILLAACGNDADPSPETIDEPTQTTEPVPTFAGPNAIELGDEKIDLVPTIQCSIFNEFTISISGTGADDDSIEFTFDVFDTETQALSITTADGTQWLTETGIEFSVDGERSVTGSAELEAINASGTESASFEFTCEQE